MKKLGAPVLVFVWFFAALGCTGLAPRTFSPSDAGGGAGADASADAGTDTGVDAGDAGADAGASADASTDADAGAGADAGADARTDASADAGADAGVDAGIDAGIPLSVTGISPSAGPANGGTFVAIYGNGFVPDASVTFGGVLGSMSYAMPNYLYVTTRAHAAGTVDVVVSIPDASVTVPNAFTFCDNLVGNRIEPTFGPAAGDASVDVEFSGLGPDASVLFGGTAGTIISRYENGASTTLTVLTPPGPILETVPVKVTTACGNVGMPSPYTNIPRIAAFAGGNSGSSQLATNVALRRPEHAVVDSARSVYVSDPARHRIYLIESNGGILRHKAGSGESWSGPDGPATETAILEPTGLALSSDGTLYFAETGGNRVRRIHGNGDLETIAGGGDEVGDDASAKAVRLVTPLGLAFDSQGRLLITERDAHLVRRLDIDANQIFIVAGTGDAGLTEDPMNAIAAAITSPTGIVGDVSITIDYPAISGFAFVESGNGIVRFVDNNGATSILVGNGAQPLDAGLPATSLLLDDPYGLARTPEGNLLISQVAPTNRIILFNSSNATVSPFIGTSQNGDPGESVYAPSAKLNAPRVATASNGTVYVLEADIGWVRVVDAGQMLVRIGGTGAYGPNFWGDDGSATSAGLSSPSGIAVSDSADAPVVTIADALNHRIRQISADGTIATLAGDGVPGFSDGDGGLFSAMFNQPRAVAVIPNFWNSYLVTDTNNNRVRKLTSYGGPPGWGSLSTIAGNGDAGYFGEGGYADAGGFGAPSGIAVSNTGETYFASWGNHVVLKVASNGRLIRVAGIADRPTPDPDGGLGVDAGDGDLATNATLNSPSGIAFDTSGNLLIADLNNHRIRRVLLPMWGDAGIIESVAGNGVAGSSRETIPALGAAVANPMGICVDDSNRIFFTENETGRVRMIARNDAGIEMIYTVVAAPLGKGFYGDDAYAGDAGFLDPAGIACGKDGALYVADAEMNRVRRIR